MRGTSAHEIDRDTLIDIAINCGRRVRYENHLGLLEVAGSKRSDGLQNDNDSIKLELKTLQRPIRFEARAQQGQGQLAGKAKLYVI